MEATERMIRSHNVRVGYELIDIAKLVSALLVIILHTSVPQENVNYILFKVLRYYITPIAVPFFFSVSGFFFADLIDDEKLSKRRIRKTYRMYLFWCAVYFPFVVLNWLLHPSMKSILIWLRDLVFYGGFETIWYLNALAFSFVLLTLSIKRLGEKNTVICATIIYIINLLLSSYSDVLGHTFASQIVNIYYNIFGSTKNGLLFGFPFVTIGYLVRLYNKQFRRLINNVWNNILIFVSLAVLFIEVYFRTTFIGIGRSPDFSVMTPVLICFLLLLLSGSYSEIENKWIVMGRRYSTLLFLLQRIPLTFIYYIDRFFNVSIRSNFILYTVLVLSTTLLLTILFDLTSKKWTNLKKLAL